MGVNCSFNSDKGNMGRRVFKSGSEFFKKGKLWYHDVTNKNCPVKREDKPLNSLGSGVTWPTCSRSLQLKNLVTQSLWLFSCLIGLWPHTPQARLPPPINEEMRCQHTSVYSTLIYLSTGSRSWPDHRRHQMIEGIFSEWHCNFMLVFHICFNIF